MYGHLGGIFHQRDLDQVLVKDLVGLELVLEVQDADEGVELEV